MCHVCGVLYPNGRSFLSHAEIFHITNYSAASQPHTLTSSTNVCQFPGRSNDRDFLKEMIRETLVGDYWTRERRDIPHNEGSTAGQPGKGIVLIDITDDADPPTSQANQYRSLPESSSSSSDETDDSLPTSSNIRPDRLMEDEETQMRKKTLVDRLFIERGFRHFSCGACTYWTECRRCL